jgi:hypothetical protein
MNKGLGPWEVCPLTFRHCLRGDLTNSLGTLEGGGVCVLISSEIISVTFPKLCKQCILSFDHLDAFTNSTCVTSWDTESHVKKFRI